MRGLEKPTAGQILLDGQSVSSVPSKLLSRKVELLAENPVFMPGTILENLLLANPDADKRGSNLSEDILQLLSVGSEHRLSMSYELINGGENLSSSQRQIIGLARALALNPRYLLLDEPATNLDLKNEQQIYEILGRFSKDHTLIIASNKSSSLNMIDRVLHLHQGQLIFDGPREKFLAASRRFDKQHKQ